MRIHELLEVCVEYIAFDGVIGSDPARLLQHLITLDPSLDFDYFTHVWALLCAHPSIQIILTSEPILIPGGTTDLGTAPLPEGWLPPQHIHNHVDIDSLYKEGVRGRQLAFMLAGQEFRSDKEAIQDKRDAQVKRTKRIKQAGYKNKKPDSDEEEPGDVVKIESSGLVHVLSQDDGGDDPEAVAKTDLRTLWKKWGARLRIRCIDDEIYYRLTGSHQKIPKITSTVFHILQLAAMSREKGITAIDLGPLVGSSQGSMHYYMKVLVGLGLCAKVPAVLHAAVTNLLVFHRFLDRNPNYLALAGKPVPQVPQAQTSDAQAEEDDSGDEKPTDPSVDDLASFAEWGFDFTPISETQLMAGHLVKERLLKMLDHPRLKNHLLMARNLLQPLGWTGSAVMRHRRAVKRHIDTLVFEGVVERLTIGGTGTSCIRLSKYNPDRPLVERDDAIDSEVPEAEEHDLEVISAQPPYMSQSGVPLTLTFEYLITELVSSSGQAGMTITSLWRNSDFMWKRAIDFAILRADNAHLPGHLWPRAISSVMETIGKERRLRLFTTAAYQRIMNTTGQELVGYPSLAAPEIAGLWADLTYRHFFHTPDQYNRFLNGSKLAGETSSAPKKIGRPKGSTKVKPTPESTPVVEADEREVTKINPRDFKYDNSVQVRGRPRKYVHVVTEDGAVDRRIIGTVYSRPDLPPILIFLKERNLLVVAPPGYSGVGPPPPVAQEMMSSAKPPSFYYQFPTRDPAAFSGQKGAKAKAKEKREELKDAASKEATAGIVNSTPEVAEPSTKGKHNTKKGKKRGKERSDGSGAETTPANNRKSKRPKKAINYTDGIDENRHNDIAEIADPNAVDQAIAVLPGQEAGRSESLRPTEAVHPELVVAHAEPTESPITETVTGTKTQAAEPQLVDAPGTSVSIIDATSDPEVPADNARDTHVVNSLETQAPAARVLGASRESLLEPPATTNSEDTPPSRKSGRQKKQAVPPDTQSSAPERPKRTRKSKAADLPAVIGITQAPSSSADSPSLPSNAVAQPEPAETSPKGQDAPTAGSKILPHVINDNHFFHVPMETSIGTVLAELAESGVRPRSVGESSTPDQRDTKGKKRKSLAGDTGTPPQAKMSAPDATPLFAFPEIPMSESAFELPLEYVAPKTNNKGGSREEVVADITPHIQGPSRTTDQAHPITMPPPLTTTPVRPSHLAKTPTSRPQTPLRQMSLDNAGFSSSRSGTPLHDSTQPIKNQKLHYMMSGNKPNNSRIDLGNIRRANEIFQVLTINGGVLVDTKLAHEHRTWVYKYAGTDHPHAPAVPYGMDRTVVKKTVNTLLNEGRAKETIVTIPTPTGRWIKASVIYITDLPQEQLQAYIRQLSSTVTQAMTPTPRKDKGSMASTPYTEIKTPTTYTNSRAVVNVTPSQDQREHRPFSERRMALLKEAKVVSQLYGWKAARCVRIQTLYRAMLKAFEDSTSTSIISRSPRIFAVPLLVEEITVKDWFSVVLLLQYNEEIEQWIHDPVNLATKVKDVPRRYRPAGGFAGARTKGKLSTLLQILVSLKLITPVVPVAKSEADFFANESEENGFKVEEGAPWSTYYMIHDYVPIYHLASLPPPLLGILPAKTEADVDKIWDTFKMVSLQSRMDVIGRIGEQTNPGLPAMAKMTDVLDISPDHTRLFQQRKRWRDEIDPVSVQRAALDQVFDTRTGQPTINTKAEIQAFAYEYALPPLYVEEELKHRTEETINKANRIALRLRESARKAQERQDKLQNTIRQKLLERQEVARQEWEQRVEAAARRKEITYDSDLLEFVSRHTLLSGSMKRVEATDLIIDHWVAIWVQTQGMTEAEREKVIEERRRQINGRREAFAPKLKWVSQRKRATKAKEPKPAGPRRRVRSKIKWTHEDDDFFLDAEAIIRARSRGTSYKGRAAMNQVYPKVSSQTFLSRVRKVTAQPGKKAYLERLEQAWYDVWNTYKGTADLEDPHPDSPTEFDLQKHLDFLRMKIDKRPLKLLAIAMATEEEDPAPDLPIDIKEVLKEHQWVYVHTDDHSLDVAADSVAAEDMRINSVTAVSLVEESRTPVVQDSVMDMGVLQAVLKMIVGTPTAIYDPADGEELLSNWSSEVYDNAIEHMVERNIFKKQQTSASTAGRFFTFAQQWQQLNEGLLPEDHATDAHNLEVKLESQDGVRWPILGNPGELVALMGMVSNHQIDFGFDVMQFPTVVYESSHYNTRKLDDDVYEFDLQVKKVTPPVFGKPSYPLPDLKRCKPLSPWPLALDADLDLQQTVDRVLSAVTAAGPEGTITSKILDIVDCSRNVLSHALATIATSQNTPVFWAGYDTARLVSREHWDHWAIRTHPKGLNVEVAVLTNPRRWSDLYGSFMKDDWEVAVNAVRSLVVTRPGITHHRLRTKTETILDRLELVDVLEYLAAIGSLTSGWSSGAKEEEILPPVEAIGMDQETRVAWFPHERTLW